MRVPGNRVRKNAFIVAFLLFQLVTPLTYYVSGRGPDERFSWRMFSTVRMHRCQIKVEAVQTLSRGERVRDVDPAMDVQAAWVNILRRYRPAVVEQYLARVCEQHDAARARFERECIDTEGSQLPAQLVTRDCASGAVDFQERGL